MKLQNSPAFFSLASLFLQRFASFIDLPEGAVAMDETRPFIEISFY